MAAKFSLSDSLAERQNLTTAQSREIERLYKDLAKKAAKEAERLKSSTLSGKLQAVELGKLEKKLQEEADKIGARLESSIPSAMKKAATGVVSDATAFQAKLGISIEGAYRHVPTDIVEILVSGKLYKGKWSLSKSIWADVAKTQADISKVVAEGIALNKSSYDIAKDLEMYVDPSAKKPWDWSKVYPGTKKKIDYNAQRLARTMAGHAYQQSVVAVCKDDPFVDGVEWISGHSTTTCELCRDRNGKVFPAEKLPMDHPNGKCSFAPHVSKSLSQIGDDLADWVQGKPNKRMDKWFKGMYPDADLGGLKEELQKKSTESIADKIAKAKSIKDYNKIMNESKWFTTKTYLQGCDEDAAGAITSMYATLFDKFPQLAGKFPAPEVKELRANVYANCRTTTDGGISINKLMFSNWEKVSKKYKYDVFIGFHPEGTTPASILTHEFGHAIDGYIGRASGKETLSSDVISKVLKKAKISDSQVKLKISSYAAKNERECFAELFAEYITSENPSEAAKLLGQEISNALKGL